MFFKATERLELQLNIENLTDETYFSDAHISTGAPINARLTARVAF